MSDPSNGKRPSLRESDRRGVEAKQAQAAQTPPPTTTSAASTSPAQAPSSQRPKPPVVGIEQVVVKCGHTAPFELFDLKKDKYRADRRKKLTDKD